MRNVKWFLAMDTCAATMTRSPLSLETVDAYPSTSNRGQKTRLREASQNFTLGGAFCCSVALKYSAFSTPAIPQKLLPKKERA